MTQTSTSRQTKNRHDYQPAAFNIKQVDLRVELDPEATIVTAVLQITRQQQAAALVLDGSELTLLSVAIDGIALSRTQYQQTAEQLIIDKVPDNFELQLVTRIAPKHNTALEGLYMAGAMYCTQCEAEGFRRITYFLDRPDVLSIYTTTIIADAQSYPYLLSNGNKIADKMTAEGKREVSWHDPYPKPCYLFALVAGDFDVLSEPFTTQSGRVVSLQLFVDKGAALRGDFALQALKRAMRWDEQRFNLEYDLDIYMVVATDFFNMGAMENKGLNIFNSKYVLADADSATDKDFYNIESIIGHEYFHNWTGNRVTCRDWFQLSLKEGLTVFRDQEFSADMSSATLTRIDAIKVIRTAQFAEDAGPMSHPIRPEQVLEMNNFYTVTVYDKGAEVIRMLQTLLGKKKFAQGLSLYLQRHDGQAATCDDFIQAMQDVSSLDLNQFRLWYSQSGTPQLRARQRYDQDSLQLTLSVSQHTAATADQTTKQPLQMPVAIELLFADGQPKQRHTLILTDEQQQFVLEGISTEPVVVWLEHFSAPVKLDTHYTDDALLRIAADATDGVARWDAMQQFWSAKIAEAVSTNSRVELPTALYTMMSAWLKAPGEDLALTAELLSLPDFDTLAEQYATIPVDALLATLKSLKRLLAQRLSAEFLQCYQAQPVSPYRYANDAAGRRHLRQICLYYLAEIQLDAENLIRQQLKLADNLTDRLAALHAAQQAELACFGTLIQQFALHWPQDVLVMDKCFGLVATDPSAQVFTAMTQMQQHPLFNWNNPNRVRALYSAFSMRNPSQFHRADGQGYQLLGQVVTTLDPINPQVAARLVTPLLSWRRFDGVRRDAMQQVLQQLLALPALSNDLYEKVNRSLA